MKRIKSNYHYLKVLKNAKPKERKVILESANDELIKAIIECVINTLNGNHRVSGKIKSKLCKYKNCLRKLANPKNSLKTKRKLLVQQGGFLIPLLTSVLSGIVGSIISK